MSELVVIGFDDAFKAFELRVALMKMQAQFGIRMEDAAVVARDPQGRIKLDQTFDLQQVGASETSFWGLLVPAMLLPPLPGDLSAIGVDDRFTRELAEILTPGSSALFVRVRDTAPDGILASLRGVGGRVMQTSLTGDRREDLQRALAARASHGDA